jgi:hypothetical protein
MGLKLREAMLCSAMLFNSEAWSHIPDTEWDRIEVVDTALLRGLVGGHSKASKEFYYLEMGVLMLRHKATIRRLMYHKQILDRVDTETTKKIYLKQKENPLKGD